MFPRIFYQSTSSAAKGKIMTEKKYTPSPWEHPELYEKFVEEHPRQEKAKQTLKDYIEDQLSAGGFYIEEEGDKIRGLYT